MSVLGLGRKNGGLFDGGELEDLDLEFQGKDQQAHIEQGFQIRSSSRPCFGSSHRGMWADRSML